MLANGRLLYGVSMESLYHNSERVPELFLLLFPSAGLSAGIKPNTSFPVHCLHFMTRFIDREKPKDLCLHQSDIDNGEAVQTRSSRKERHVQNNRKYSGSNMIIYNDFFEWSISDLALHSYNRDNIRRLDGGVIINKEEEQ